MRTQVKHKILIYVPNFNIDKTYSDVCLKRLKSSTKDAVTVQQYIYETFNRGDDTCNEISTREI